MGQFIFGGERYVDENREEFFYYLRLSSFCLNKVQENKFNKLLLDLKNIKKCKYIIFDIRNNRGGSTYYAEKIFSNLSKTNYFTLFFQKICLIFFYVFEHFIALIINKCVICVSDIFLINDSLNHLKSTKSSLLITAITHFRFDLALPSLISTLAIK